MERGCEVDVGLVLQVVKVCRNREPHFDVGIDVDRLDANGVGHELVFRHSGAEEGSLESNIHPGAVAYLFGTLVDGVADVGVVENGDVFASNELFDRYRVVCVVDTGIDRVQIVVLSHDADCQLVIIDVDVVVL